jgi:large-conductance mechanosensitive channel
MMTGTRYHASLRTVLLVGACVLVFDSGLVSPLTREFSDNALTYVASSVVGVMVGVPENEINALTAQIAERQRELDLRERNLQEREISTRDFGADSTNDYSTFILSAILFVLTSLIVLNYVLDWNRSRKVTTYAEQTT